MTSSSISPEADPADSGGDGGLLSWGRRYLVCPPSHFGVLYEINPWMHKEVAVDPDRARTQWEDMVANLESAGAVTVPMEPIPGLPDLVFTANAGLVHGNRFVVSRFRHTERRQEARYDAEWFARAGFEVDELPVELGVCFEGAGDALPFRGRLVSGYRFRSDFVAHGAIAGLLKIPVVSVELKDARFYHLDLTFCPLDDRRAICAPQGWDRYGLAVMQRLVPEPLILELDEALSFCANSVVINHTIVMPACPPRVGRVLEGWGYDVCISPVDEFMKAGGGVRCLTLALDVTLGK
ncbi:MAG: dimethylarginine dimethylaminohydrolase family protein [Acidimicrobiia bacterium]